MGVTVGVGEPLGDAGRPEGEGVGEVDGVDELEGEGDGQGSACGLNDQHFAFGAEGEKNGAVDVL